MSRLVRSQVGRNVRLLLTCCGFRHRTVCVKKPRFGLKGLGFGVSGSGFRVLGFGLGETVLRSGACDT